MCYQVRNTLRSNRTFMELKHVMPNVLTFSPLVLIVPLWN